MTPIVCSPVRLFNAILIVVLCVVADLHGDDPSLIDSGKYPNDQAAQKAWKPMSDSPPVASAKHLGTPSVKMTCDFAETTNERGAWDFETKLDLSASHGIRFQIACPDPTPIRSFGIYCQSGNGWYVASFYPETLHWNNISLDLKQFVSEGEPSGWNDIRRIRISAWRGKDMNTEFYLRDLHRTGVLGIDSHVLLIASPKSDPERNDSLQYVAATKKRYLDSDVLSTIIDDEDVTVETLALAQIVVLPHSPGLSEKTVQSIAKYLDRGGKLLSFYGLPPLLQTKTGVQLGKYIRDDNLFGSIHLEDRALPGCPRILQQHSHNIIDAAPSLNSSTKVLAVWHDTAGQRGPHNAIVGSKNAIHMTHVLLGDDSANKGELLFAMTGSLEPRFWIRRIQSEEEKLDNLGPYHKFRDAIDGIRRAAVGIPIAEESLAQSVLLHSESVQYSKARRYHDALIALRAARVALLKAYCATKKSEAGEFRGFWCHDATGVEGMSWDAAINNLSANGFNAIFPNMLWGGGTSYESEFLPTLPKLVGKGDQVAECLAACRKYSLQIHVWKVNWNMGNDVDPSFLQSMKELKRVQVSREGREESWLCPSSTENQQLEVNSMVEVVRKYAVDGIHFDYIRYPDKAHCFCDRCRERFGNAIGQSIAGREEFVSLVDTNGPYHVAWNDWRRSHITNVVRETSVAARAVNPNIKLSAAVFRDWPIDRDLVGQDWSLWCKEGYLDFVCPMDYTPSDFQLDDWIRNQQIWAHGKPVYPGIGAWQIPPESTLKQIEITRKYKTKGFLLFNYGPKEANELLPLLGIGITRPN